MPAEAMNIADTNALLGYQPGHDGDLGRWVISIPGGHAFASNAIVALSVRASALPPRSPARECFERIRDAFVDAREPRSAVFAGEALDVLGERTPRRGRGARGTRAVTVGVPRPGILGLGREPERIDRQPQQAVSGADHDRRADESAEVVRVGEVAVGEEDELDRPSLYRFDWSEVGNVA